MGASVGETAEGLRRLSRQTVVQPDDLARAHDDARTLAEQREHPCIAVLRGRIARVERVDPEAAQRGALVVPKRMKAPELVAELSGRVLLVRVTVVRCHRFVRAAGVYPPPADPQDAPQVVAARRYTSPARTQRVTTLSSNTDRSVARR